MDGPRKPTFEFEGKIFADLTLTDEQRKELEEKLRCAVVLLLPQRVTCEQVTAKLLPSPKAPRIK
jgi:hypothetical protein